MEWLEISRKVDKSMSWVSNLIVEEKPNKSLRICLNRKDLNKAIKRHRYPMPTPEEIFSKMSGATVFFKLDGSNAYWQVKCSITYISNTNWQLSIQRKYNFLQPEGGCSNWIEIHKNKSPSPQQTTLNVLFPSLTKRQFHVLPPAFILQH